MRQVRLSSLSIWITNGFDVVVFLRVLWLLHSHRLDAVPIF